MNRLQRSLLVTLAIAAGCGGQKETTGLTIEITSPDFRPGVDIDEVALQRTINGTLSLFVPVTSESGFPTFSVVPERSANDRTWIKVTGFSRQQEMVSTGALVGFVKGQTRRLALQLLQPCRGVRCPDDPKRACRADIRECADLPVVEVTQLPVASSEPRQTDAAAAPRDAGVDAPIAIRPLDASAPDARIADTRRVDTRVVDARSVDAAPDSPPACAENATRTCASFGNKGRCASGTATCRSGQWTGCPIAMATDSCATMDSDENCNGVPSEGCACVNGRTRACTPCVQDVQTCRDGQWSLCPQYAATDRLHCGPTCKACPLAPNATVSCTNNDCKKECDFPLPSTCQATDGVACGSWAFESTTGNEGWIRSYESAWDGSLWGIRMAPDNTTRALAIGFDNWVSTMSRSWSGVGVGVTLCSTGTVDMRGKRLTARAYVQGRALGNDNQVYWVGSSFINASGNRTGLYPEVGIEWNKWFNIDVSLSGAAADPLAKSIAFTFWIGVPAAEQWKGTIYLDNVKLQ